MTFVAHAFLKKKSTKKGKKSIMGLSLDEGRKSSNLLAIKMQGTNCSGEGGIRACYVTSDLSHSCSKDYQVGGREQQKGEDNKWDGKKGP